MNYLYCSTTSIDLGHWAPTYSLIWDSIGVGFFIPYSYSHEQLVLGMSECFISLDILFIPLVRILSYCMSLCVGELFFVFTSSSHVSFHDHHTYHYVCSASTQAGLHRAILKTLLWHFGIHNVLYQSFPVGSGRLKRIVSFFHWVYLSPKLLMLYKNVFYMFYTEEVQYYVSEHCTRLIVQHVQSSHVS